MAEPSDELISVIEHSAVPTLLVRVPSSEILAASEEAGHLLGTAPKSLVGRCAVDFTTEPPSGGLVLVAEGRVHAFQAFRTLKRGDGGKQPLQVWVRAGGTTAPADVAIMVLWPGGRAPWMYLPECSDDDLIAPVLIIGTVDAHLLVERISEDVDALGRTSEEVVGTSIFTLFDVSSAADVLASLADATHTSGGLCLMVNLSRADEPRTAELLIRPLAPAPSFSFCIAIRDGTEPGSNGVADERGLQAAGHSLHGLALADSMAQYRGIKVVGAERLTSREFDIIDRLVDGDRVPAIARDLYLSQSTIRNHLSSAFRKLGVHSQQELIDLVRKTTQRLDGQDSSSS